MKEIKAVTFKDRLSGMDVRIQVGDTVYFKSDMFQQGVVKRVEPSGLVDTYRFHLAAPDYDCGGRFAGAYIGGDRRTIVYSDYIMTKPQ